MSGFIKEIGSLLSSGHVGAGLFIAFALVAGIWRSVAASKNNVKSKDILEGLGFALGLAGLGVISFVVLFLFPNKGAVIVLGIGLLAVAGLIAWIVIAQVRSR